jgi:hypothetical protein
MIMVILLLASRRRNLTLEASSIYPLSAIWDIGKFGLLQTLLLLAGTSVSPRWNKEVQQSCKAAAVAVGYYDLLLAQARDLGTADSTGAQGLLVFIQV